MNFKVFSDGILLLPSGRVRCALGKGGVAAQGLKREGDGATPAGMWPLRHLLYRPDRGPPPSTRLPAYALGPTDGWCDASDDPKYNLRVQLPYPAGAESLWRADGVYDLIAPLGYNDDPVKPGFGSAIFLHLARDGYTPTEGCVALARADLEALLAVATIGDALHVHASPGSLAQAGR